MTGILADNNVEKHLDILLYVWESGEWRELWDSLNLPLQTFEELGISRDVNDAVLWQECQRRQVVLVTANRNKEGATSLEATIRLHNRADSLPVFTLADADRVLSERAYAMRAAEKLLEYLFTIDKVRGTGRLYLP